MSFISAGFLITIALGAAVYYLVPKKYQWIVLLVMSFAFYATYGVKYIGYIIFTIISSYIFAVKMEVCEDRAKRRRLLIACLCCNFGILAGMKYINFFIGNINALSSLFGGSRLPLFNIVMPLGISFYTFQTMSYVIDVYQKKYAAQKNIFKLALFTAFLPQLLQGPIGRYDRLAPQFFGGQEFKLINLEFGAQRMAWGLAKKLVLADRAYVAANYVFSNLQNYSGAYIVFALLLFSIYVYCDFAGGMDLVIGAAQIFGITLDENFRQPYFSKSLGEFWRRWHISLGAWMKDYVFYPFSISKKMLRFSKFAKKRFGKTTGRVLPICLANILIFFIVGVWHGASWKYIIYGFYNGIIIAVSSLLKPVFAAAARKCRINTSSAGWKAVSILRTFIIVNIGWLFDACQTASLAFKAFGRIFINFRLDVLWDGSLLNLGLNLRDYKVLAVAVLILFITSVMKERGIKLREFVAERPVVVRWALYIILVFVTAPFGYVGSTTEFVYAQF